MGFAATLDMYRKVPSDLLEGTRRGSFFSLCAVFSMATLFFLETRAFLRTKIVTDLHLDDNPEKKIRVNFNISMMDLACEYAVVDVVSFLGTEQNVTAHINKWSLDAEGVKKRFQGRNKLQNDILFSDETVTETIEELHQDGEQAESFDKNTFEESKADHRYLFVDFFAPWCSHCQVLAPTWEALGELMHKVAEKSVDDLIKEHYPDSKHNISALDLKEATTMHRAAHIGKVDCTQNSDLCQESKIFAYPTLRLYVDGEFHSDYKEDRTVLAFTHYLSTVESTYESEDNGENEVDTDTEMNKVNTIAKSRGLPHHHDRLRNEESLKRQWSQWRDEEHPGCQLSGFLLLDRVPGNFHILAKSNSKDLVPSLTNVSHEVHSLSFGDPSLMRTIQRGKSTTPDNLTEQLEVFNGNVYVTKNQHHAYHHHLKVVTTNFEYSNYGSKYRPGRAYQILAQSQITRYNEHEVPEAKFVYDLAPVAIKYSRSYRKWYDYLTSIMAIIGGTFTVIGMLESSLHAATSKKNG